jgi:FAD/FMN-containing dehydrogenase
LTFKLRPRPAREATLVARAHDALALYGRARQLIAAEFLPVAVELLSPRFTTQLGLPEAAGQFALLIRFAGAAANVSSQLERARALFEQDAASLEIISDDAILWRSLAAAALRTEHELRLRAHVKPSDLPLLFNTLTRSQRDGHAFSWHAGLADGRLRVSQSVEVEGRNAASELNAMRRIVEENGGSLVVEAAPDEIRSEVERWHCVAANAMLMRRVKQQLDPRDLLCRGFFS